MGRRSEVGKVLSSGSGMGSSSPSSVMRTARRGSGRGAKRIRRERGLSAPVWVTATDGFGMVEFVGAVWGRRGCMGEEGGWRMLPQCSAVVVVVAMVDGRNEEREEDRTRSVPNRRHRDPWHIALPGVLSTRVPDPISPSQISPLHSAPPAPPRSPNRPPRTAMSLLTHKHPLSHPAHGLRLKTILFPAPPRTSFLCCRVRQVPVVSTHTTWHSHRLSTPPSFM